MLWLTIALAHPLGGVMPSHDVVVELAEDTARVRYAVRLPTHDVLEDVGDRSEFSPADAEDFNVARLRELRDELALSVDGERLAWTSNAPTEESGTGNSRFVLFEQDLVAPLRAGELTLRNGNTPDSLSYFRVAFEVAPRWTVDDCSLFRRVEEGAVLKSDNGVWSLEEASREVTLVLRQTSALEGLLGQDAVRSVDLAVAPPFPWTWAVGGLAVLLSAALGLMSALRRRAARPA
jgi:hypothetical protein